jgi:hypothetical protein
MVWVQEWKDDVIEHWVTTFDREPLLRAMDDFANNPAMENEFLRIVQETIDMFNNLSWSGEVCEFIDYLYIIKVTFRIKVLKMNQPVAA